MSLWDNCRSRAPERHTHGRGDEQQVSRNSLQKSGLDGFQYVNHFQRGQRSFCTFVTGFGASALNGLFNTFSGQNTKGYRDFAVLSDMRQPLLAPPATYSKWAVPPRITVPSAITASYLPVFASAPAASGSSYAPRTQTTVMFSSLPDQCVSGRQSRLPAGCH